MSWASGRTDRIRATASRTEATLLARSVLSTIARSQHAARAELLDRPEVEVLENGSGAAGRERRRVAREDRAPIAERTVRQAGRRLVEKHEIDAPAGGCFEPGRQRSQLHRVELMRASHADRHVHVAVRVGLPRDTRSKMSAYATRGSDSKTERSCSIIGRFRHRVYGNRPRSKRRTCWRLTPRRRVERRSVSRSRTEYGSNRWSS